MSNLSGRGPLGLKAGKGKNGTAAGLEHMRRVKQLPCVICQAPPPSDAHHCISGRYGSRRASDFETIPLCKECHQDGPMAIHRAKESWERMHGPDTDYLPLVARWLNTKDRA